MLDELLDRAELASVPTILGSSHDLEVDDIQLHSPLAAPRSESEEATVDPLEVYLRVTCAQVLLEPRLNWIISVNDNVPGF